MKVFLVVDETRFFHPDFVAGLIAGSKDEFVGAALVTKVAPKSNIDTWLRRNWFRLKISEIVMLCWKKFLSIAQEKLRSPKPGAFYSVRSVLTHYGIDFQEVHYDINKPEHLDFIRSKKPDVIFSSCSVIFKTELLKIPSKACINRHSGLLPAYGGLWPVFQAYRSGETLTGASVHTMELGIDRGVVLAQKTVPMPTGSRLYDLYRQCFQISVDAALEALGKVRSGNLLAVQNGKARSYFSFPTPEHWREFRARGGRFI